MSATLARTSSTVFAWMVIGAWKSVPPVNSMPRLRPRISSASTETATITPETMNHSLRCFMKS